MERKEWKWEVMNEPAVREQIIAPMLLRLGYETGTQNDISHEKPLVLRHSKDYLGRKKKTDRPLSGRPDYIITVENGIRWVLEAKGANEEIDIECIEQAYTYARHPEVAAVLYGVCNGRELQIFLTSRHPDAGCVLRVTADEHDSRWLAISNLLSPAQLKTTFPLVQIDERPPLAEGLRSSARIVKGEIRYLRNSAQIRQFDGMGVFIDDGGIERTDEGTLVVLLRTRSCFGPLQSYSEATGLDSFEATSTDREISRDPSRPTVFQVSHDVTFRQGERIFNPLTWREEPVLNDIRVLASVTGSGFLCDRVFSGAFSYLSNTQGVSMRMDGTIVLHLE